MDYCFIELDILCIQLHFASYSLLSTIHQRYNMLGGSHSMYRHRRYFVTMAFQEEAIVDSLSRFLVSPK